MEKYTKNQIKILQMFCDVYRTQPNALKNERFIPCPLEIPHPQKNRDLDYLIKKELIETKKDNSNILYKLTFLAMPVIMVLKEDKKIVFE